MDPRQTINDEPSGPVSTGPVSSGPASSGPRGELLALVRSLRGHLEELEASGAWGLPAAPVEAPVARGSAAPSSSQRLASSAPEAEANAAAAQANAPLPGAARQPAPAVRVEPGAAGVEAASRDGSAMAGSPALGVESKPLVHLPQASVDRLQALAEQASTCTRCALHEGRHQSVFARGGGSSGVVFVGEGPGEEEDRQGFPFVGPAGQLLDRMIAAMQLGRDDVYVCNIVKCRPPKNRKPEADEMARCMPFLVEQLAVIQPRVIIALGATAVQGLLGTTEGITRLRGQWKLWQGKVPVMPTFHPAYLLRTPQAKREVWKDLQEVLRHLNGDAPRPA